MLISLHTRSQKQKGASGDTDETDFEREAMGVTVVPKHLQEKLRRIALAAEQRLKQQKLALDDTGSGDDQDSLSRSRLQARRTSQDLLLEALEREESTYNFTVEALLNHGALIRTATEASGKELAKLMNVEERWIEVSQELTQIEQLEESAERQYYSELARLTRRERREQRRQLRRASRRASTKVVGAPSPARAGSTPAPGSQDSLSPPESPRATPVNLVKARRSAKELRDRRYNVLDNLRLQVFKHKENQVVIEKKYDVTVRRARFSKLARFALFLALLITLGILETTRNCHSAYHLQKTMADSLSHNGDDGAPAFEALSGDRADFFKFSRGALLNVLYPEQSAHYWSSQQNVNADAAERAELPSGVVNLYNRVIGRPRLRQLRSQASVCDITATFRALPPGTICFSSIKHEASHAFGPGGKYRWSSADDLGSHTRTGKVDQYPGSGYVTLLPAPTSPDARNQTERMLSELEEDGWLDAATRAVFIELTLYNPSENHFLSGRLLLEYPLSGGAVTSWHLDVVPLRRYMTADAGLVLVIQVLVVALALQHMYTEYLQFAQSLSSRVAYWSSFYNIMDVVICTLAPISIALQVAFLLNGRAIKWEAHDEFVNVERQEQLANAQTNVYSVMVFASFLKLFDYLSVFPGLYRLLVMIEMMVRQLFTFTMVLGLFLLTFTTAEFIAYGYKDENSYNVQRGFLARVFGLFSGDPVTFGHTDSDKVLGTFYVITFLISMSMVLMNLIVAVLTSAYDEARNQSSDVLAQRQYEKMDQMGLTKRHTLTFKNENGEIIKTVFTTKAEEHSTVWDKLDVRVLLIVTQLWQRVEDWLDARRAAFFQQRLRTARSAGKPRLSKRAKSGAPQGETVIIVKKGQNISELSQRVISAALSDQHIAEPTPVPSESPRASADAQRLSPTTGLRRDSRPPPLSRAGSEDYGPSVSPMAGRSKTD